MVPACVWAKIAAELRDDDTEWLSVHSSCVRVTVAAADWEKADGTGGQASVALGRSRVGFGSKLHAVVTPLGHPVALKLTGSETADSPQLPGLIAGQRADVVLTDKGYDSDANRQAIRMQGAETCIPPWKNTFFSGQTLAPQARHLLLLFDDVLKVVAGWFHNM